MSMEVRPALARQSSF